MSFRSTKYTYTNLHCKFQIRVQLLHKGKDKNKYFKLLSRISDKQKRKQKYLKFKKATRGHKNEEKNTPTGN